MPDAKLPDTRRLATLHKGRRVLELDDAACRGGKVPKTYDVQVTASHESGLLVFSGRGKPTGARSIPAEAIWSFQIDGIRGSSCKQLQRAS